MRFSGEGRVPSSVAPTQPLGQASVGVELSQKTWSGRDQQLVGLTRSWWWSGGGRRPSVMAPETGEPEGRKLKVTILPWCVETIRITLEAGLGILNVWLRLDVRWLLQSRPIQMRGTILYLANRWMDFKMLSTPNRFLDLLRVLLLLFCWIPQFILQIWLICQFLCTDCPS